MILNTETSDRIIKVLLDLIDRQQETIKNLNHALSEQVEENIDKAERLSELLRKRT